MNLKQSISKEFGNVRSYKDFKETISSLDNMFYGGLVVGIILLLCTMTTIILVPLFIIAVGYLGRLVQVLLAYFKNRFDPPPTKKTRANKNLEN